MEYSFSRRSGLILGIVFGFCAEFIPLQAQPSILTVPSATEGRSGFQIYGVSVSGSYLTSSYPIDNSLLVVPGNHVLGIGADGAMSGSAVVGWSKGREKSVFSVVYAPTYNARIQNSQWNRLNHSLLINVNHPIRIGNRW